MKKSTLEVAASAGKVMAALKNGIDGFEVLEVDDLAQKVVLATPQQGWSWGSRIDVAIIRLKKGTRLILTAKRRVAWNFTPDTEAALARLLSALQSQFPARDADADPST